MKKVLLLFITVFFFLFFSCDLLRDSPYDVEAWTPGEGFHDDPGSIIVSIQLSRESDKAKTEQAFSLTEDRKPLKGVFSWEGTRLVFTPASPLEENRIYLISLGTGAQDPKGISLENKFEAAFSTRFPEGKPGIIGTDPEHGGSLLGSRGEYRIFFSEAVSINSCMDFISFNPYTPGSWRLEDENKTASFTPREPWQAGALYSLRVDSDFTGAGGAILGTEYASVFFIGQDREKPVLLKVLAVSYGEEPAEEIPFETAQAAASEHPGWESYTRLELVFSEPVDVNGLRNLLVTEPAAALVMETQDEKSQLVRFRFSEYPRWGSSFLFRLSPGVKDLAGNESQEEYVFRIRCNGPISRPPALAGIRLPLAPGIKGESESQKAASFTLEDLFADLPIEIGEGHYPFMEKTPSWVELYFETAPGTEIDPFSVMELFRVESTNQALTFSPRNVRTGNFTWAYPKAGWENFQRVEIQGILTNMVQSGIVSFRIPAGLKDKRGNRSAEDFRVSLLK